MNYVGMVLPLVSVLAFTACDPLPAQRLEDVQIPEDFHFETARAVGLRVDVSEPFRTADTLRVEIRKPDGGLVYSGVVSDASDWAVTPRLTLPLYVEQVDVRLFGDGVDTRATMSVDETGRGTHTFG